MGTSVASRLLKEMPHEAAMAELWVRAVLPLVRLEPWILGAVTSGVATTGCITFDCRQMEGLLLYSSLCEVP